MPVHRIVAEALSGSLLSDAAQSLPTPVTDPDIISGYLQDASRRVGHASQLFRPKTELEVCAVLAYCERERIPLTVIGRQTSTTASSVPMGGAILSMEKLTLFLHLDEARALASAEAGILLGDFQETLEAQGWLYPPDPTSRNECTLGASVSCNASGARTFKYGPTRRYVERLRIALPGGAVLDVRRGQVVADTQGNITLEMPCGEERRLQCPTYPIPSVKHAAGYHSGSELDLIDLFIGAEGTLGIITMVEVALLPLPRRVLGFLAAFPGVDEAVAFVKDARSLRGSAGVDPRCLEYFDASSLELISRHDPGHALPKEAQAAVFFEQECTETDEEYRLEAVFDLLTRSLAMLEAENGVIVADTPQRQALLYELRHAVPAGVNEQAARNQMPKVGTDLAVPDEALCEMMAAYELAVSDPMALLGHDQALSLVLALEARTQEESASTSGMDLEARWDAHHLPRSFDHALFGHIGDNHLHLNFLPTTAEGLEVARAVYDVLTRRAIELSGTVSAEHGIGKIKLKALRWLLGEDAVEQMRSVKRQLDPNAILGRGNLFDLS